MPCNDDRGTPRPLLTPIESTPGLLRSRSRLGLIAPNSRRKARVGPRGNRRLAIKLPGIQAEGAAVQPDVPARIFSRTPYTHRAQTQLLRASAETDLRRAGVLAGSDCRPPGMTGGLTLEFERRGWVVRWMMLWRRIEIVLGGEG